MAVTIENKQYHENSSPEEIKALEDRVNASELNPRIIIFKEIPKPTPYSINLCFNKVLELSKDLDFFGLIVDIDKAGKPDALSRRCINKHLSNTDKLKYFTVVTGKNKLLTVVLKFALHGFSANKNFKFTSNFEEALQDMDHKMSALKI